MRTGIDALAADQMARDENPATTEDIRLWMAADGPTSHSVVLTHGGEWLVGVLSARIEFVDGEFTRVLVQYEDVPVPVAYEVQSLDLKLLALPLLKAPAL